jgi:hypothetical protein
MKMCIEDCLPGDIVKFHNPCTHTVMIGELRGWHASMTGRYRVYVVRVPTRGRRTPTHCLVGHTKVELCHTVEERFPEWFAPKPRTVEHDAHVVPSRAEPIRMLSRVTA